MGAAAMAYTLWDRFLTHNPKDPHWINRDRFVLSAGHASMLLYSLLHLTGYDLSISDLQSFRQWQSRTPGHPEYDQTPGVEMTTGPLGQGFAHGVGMAMAERFLGVHYNRENYPVVDHFTYGIVSDGDLMEGVSGEAASLAGTLGLGKLVYLYDDNGISIEGDTRVTFTEDVGARFRAYGWHVVGPIDGMHVAALATALEEAKGESTKPSLIIARTTIGFGSPNKANTGGVHGEPLGDAEIELTRDALGWDYEPFDVPVDVRTHMEQAVVRGAQAQATWNALMERYKTAFPQLAAEFSTDVSGAVKHDAFSPLESLFGSDTTMLSTRDAGNRAMNALASSIHGLTGGSADLAPSTKTIITSHPESPAPSIDHNIHFGVREHAMGAIAGGMALHGGLIPYTATFLIFSDYMRPPMRLAALMKQRVIYVFSHDSIGLGEDGPTHQPIEQLIGLRSVPNLTVIRPADAWETAFAWQAAIQNTEGPTALVLTRQNVPVLASPDLVSAANVFRGAYVLREPHSEPDAIIIGTGSEVHIALQASEELESEGIHTRVVSMPSWELFETQEQVYKDSVLPPGLTARVSIEAGSTIGWLRYVGTSGVAIGVDHFGASAPYQQIYEGFGLTPNAVQNAVRNLLGNS